MDEMYIQGSEAIDIDKFLKGGKGVEVAFSCPPTELVSPIGIEALNVIERRSTFPLGCAFKLARKICQVELLMKSINIALRHSDLDMGIDWSFGVVQVVVRIS